ncbi:MAG TPA: ABC transporter permease [Roseiflexaceae bacterium]|nr:ABC transporter permease [Roseiflexaceae bacterium]HMP39922.1 ABC transporter permease [Roseiflexaceae bacterium]
MRHVVVRLVLLPLIILAAHGLGFAYAWYARPLHAVRNPNFAGGLDSVPLFDAYRSYWWGMLAGDLGVLPRSGLPLGAVLLDALGKSLGLLIPALVFSSILGVVIGRRAVDSRRGGIAPWLTVGAALGMAMPGVFIGSLAIAALFAYLIWGPGDPPLPLRGFGWDAHLILPLLVLCVRPAAQVAQITSGLLVAELGKPYLTAARSRGVAERDLINRHAFRPALAPLFQTIAGSFRLLIAELIVVEKLFDWPGLGHLLAQALIPSRISIAAESPYFLHMPLLAGLLACLAGMLVMADLLAGMAARGIDPRLRSSV